MGTATPRAADVARKENTADKSVRLVCLGLPLLFAACVITAVGAALLRQPTFSAHGDDVRSHEAGGSRAWVEVSVPILIQPPQGTHATFVSTREAKETDGVVTK